jgi:hypothetical protein
MLRAIFPDRIRYCASTIVVMMVGQSFVQAEGFDDRRDRDHGRPVYQRRAFDWKDDHGRDHKDGRFHGRHAFAPQVSSGWFQRPYPYHLDYYKMRYGGSYAPYFGNLYGPPQVVTAPPYYGPYFGSFVSGEANGQFPNGAVYPGWPGAAFEQPADATIPSQPPSGPSNGEMLPAP